MTLYQSSSAAAGAAALLLVIAVAAPQPGAASGPAQAPDRAAISKPPAPSPAALVRYDRDVRPILSDRCFKCHGFDTATRQADLRLDERESALISRSGVAAIVPGDPEASELWRRISSESPAEVMPPPESAKRPLSDGERGILRQWIVEGAAYEPHWSFVAPVRPPLPPVQDASWPRTPIDSFVLARLEADGVAPAADADPETLLRRMFLDLTGLPPTPQELDAYLADPSPAQDRLERWADKLFSVEPYRSRHAERMAAPWLDAARYADTSGIHTDPGRQMWAWRDWVLQAYRDNMPFDQFVTEQLAGDLLPDATLAQKVATGFHRNHVTTDEGGALAEEYLVEYAVDRAATTGAVFLGLTVACARCHDHKFDPISQEEFYRFYAYFNSIDEPGLYSQLADSNRAFEPFIQVPTPEQLDHLAQLTARVESARGELDQASPQESAARAEFLSGLGASLGLAWSDAPVASAESSSGASLTPQSDGSLLATGENPDIDDHTITLRVEGGDLRLIALEALPDPSLAEGRVGRSPNGNAVLSRIEVAAAPIANPSQQSPVKLIWAWADVEQADGNFRVVNALDGEGDRGWAVDAHRRPGPRVAMFLADQPFGFEGGTLVRVTLKYRSVYAKHTLGRVRLRVGRISDAGVERLPPATGSWHIVGPFPLDLGARPYEQSFEPEGERTLDLTRNFGFGNQSWRFVADYLDEKVNALPEGVSIHYAAKLIFSPSARSLDVSLGSDDGFKLLLNGAALAAREVERGVAPDQDQAKLQLEPGLNMLVFKIVNTGGQAGFYFRTAPREAELIGYLTAALLPEAARRPELTRSIEQEWKLNYSPGYRERRRAISELERQAAAADAAIPRTMIMKELPEPRPTFVLKRGAYDQPDPARPAPRGVPAALGQLPPTAPDNRLGLAQWLTHPENPLVARVAVNRLWELLFGVGLVATSEDFGMQGEWPSHPELLDWLAVEFREQGWDVRRMLRLMVTSRAYQQRSTVRPELRERDPENRALAYFPRRRLPAETIRDQALYVSGLLKETLGGASVKPYQPEGLWPEIAMPQSNTRDYRQDQGDGLWRRSIYTYWKRACPPPTMMAFDAPTREACTIRRAVTNTPLQALALWNDEQFVEAARGLAQRCLELSGDESERLTWAFRACTGRAPQPPELERLKASVVAFRQRYKGDPQAAAALLRVGAHAKPERHNNAELAAWTMVCSALLNLSSTISQQ